MDRVARLLHEVFDGRADAALTAESFRDVEGFDSLAYIELVSAVEREFEIELTAEEVQEILSYDGMRAVLASRSISS